MENIPTPVFDYEAEVNFVVWRGWKRALRMIGLGIIVISMIAFSILQTQFELTYWVNTIVMCAGIALGFALFFSAGRVALKIATKIINKSF